MSRNPASLQLLSMRIVVLLLVLGCGRAALAQEIASSFADVSKAVKAGNTVFVQDEKGERTKGKISELSNTSIQLMTGGFRNHTVTLPADRVSRISKVDSRWNGFLIGVAAGVVPGLLLGKGFKSWCVNESGSHCDRAYPFTAVPLGLVGGWIGSAIDGTIDGQTLVFRR
jgi:hypothetical protein